MRQLNLRPYQQTAVDFIMEHKAAGLFLDMGLGKTAITLSAIYALMYDYFSVLRVLVIAPLRVAQTTWVDECKSWDNFSFLRLVPILGTARQRQQALTQPADINTINVDNLSWLVEHCGKDWAFDMVVLDESSLFKNWQSKRFKALRKVRRRISRLVLLSGTPAPNGLIDLWAQLYLLDGGERLEKRIGLFRERYFTPGAGYGHIVYEYLPKPNAGAEISHAIADICMSLRAQDCIDLPPVVSNVIKVQMDDLARKLYRQMKRDMVLSLGNNEIVATNAAALSNKLLQMAQGFAYEENGEAMEIHEAKLDALREIVETNKGKPLLVFYTFRHDLEQLQFAFDARPLRDADDVRDWNAGKIPMLLVHPASAGHGLNLQYGGNVVVWYSLTWSLELYQQANKRLHRSGQTHTVVIHHLVAAKTIDERVMAALHNKRIGQDALLEAVKAELKEG